MYFAALNNAALWNNYKSYRNKLTSLLRLRKKQYYHEYINKHKNNARVMWQLINSHLGQLCNISANLTISATDLNNFFVELGSDAVKDNPVPRNDFRTYLKHQVAQSFFVAPATCDEISSVVRALPSKTSCDCNGLSVKLPKHFVNTIINSLCTIVNKSFTNGIFPNSLKITKIVSIFKAGDRSDVKNYRPMSLLPIFSKVLEKLMLARLSTFICENNVLNAHQLAFDHCTLLIAPLLMY